MVTIRKNLTKTNYRTGKNRTIKYIVIHYTANNGDTAEGNANYFKTNYRGASAHYFVDPKEIVQVVEDKNISWHCGDSLKSSSGGGKYHGLCTNANSIGVEMCSRKKNGVYYIEEDVLQNTADLVIQLREKYNIPLENVIRHFDVSGKLCPYPYTDNTKWQTLKARFEKVEKIYNKLEEFNSEYQTALKWCIDKGILKGNGTGLGLTKSEAKGLVFLYRAMNLK